MAVVSNLVPLSTGGPGLEVVSIARSSAKASMDNPFHLETRDDALLDRLSQREQPVTAHALILRVVHALIAARRLLAAMLTDQTLMRRDAHALMAARRLMQGTWRVHCL